jgi:hypothetical protein
MVGLPGPAKLASAYGTGQSAKLAMACRTFLIAVGAPQSRWNMSAALKSTLMAGKFPEHYSPHVFAFLDDAPGSLLVVVVAESIHVETSTSRSHLEKPIYRWILRPMRQPFSRGASEKSTYDRRPGLCNHLPVWHVRPQLHAGGTGDGR